MTDEEDLLAAIQVNPNDDLPRLVYADYLDEQDQPERAEFIRCQIIAERPCETAETRARHQQRAEQLLAEHGNAWKLPYLPGVQLFHRGMLETIETSAQALLSINRNQLACLPLRKLRLVNVDVYIDQLARLPIWSTIEQLVLNNNMLGIVNRIERFLHRVALPQLRSLSLQNNRLWPESLRVLLDTPAISQLHHLNLSGNPIGSSGFEQLCDEPRLLQLRELVLRSDELPYADCIHHTAARAFSEGAYLTQLTTLNLAGHSLQDSGTSLLAYSLNTTNLEHLDLSYNDLGLLGADVYQLLTNPYYLPNLISLNLSGNRFDGEAARVLLAEWPSQLQQIQVMDCQLEDDASEVFQRAARAGRLVLDLDTSTQSN